jgi:hypothetical protein
MGWPPVILSDYIAICIDYLHFILYKQIRYRWATLYIIEY